MPKKAVAALKAKTASAVKTPAAIKPLKDPFTKASLVSHLSSHSGLESKQVKTVLAALEDTIAGALHKKGAGEFTLPGLLKITAVKVPAKPKRKGKDPFTGEEREFAAKPASVRVKVRPLKKLKDAAIV